jgi:hypothetical protein
MHTGGAPRVLQSRGFLSEVRCGKCPNTDTSTYTALHELLVKLLVIMAQLADAADSNPPTFGSWGFDSPSRHHKINSTSLIRFYPVDPLESRRFYCAINRSRNKMEALSYAQTASRQTRVPRNLQARIIWSAEKRGTGRPIRNRDPQSFPHY